MGFVHAMDEEPRKRKEKGSTRGAMVSNYGKPRKPYPREKVQKKREQRNAEKMGNAEI